MEKSLENNKDTPDHKIEFDSMNELKRKLFKLDIPFFIKNSIVDVYDYKKPEKSKISIIFMEFLSGSKL